MKVSVIIPVYNREEMVLNAVTSVLSQDFKDLECIVLDDGSTDSSLQTVNSIQDSRLRVFSSENRGVSAARNMAISKAQGDYIALLDSDDVWLPQKLEVQLNYMCRNGYEISQTDETWMRQGKKVKKGRRNKKIEGWIFKESLETCLISPSCTVFSRKIWERCGPFDELMPAYEDFDLWIRICRNYPIGFIPEELTIRNGGRTDQLTSLVSYPDIYRMYAMLKLFRSSDVTFEQREMIKTELECKLGYYSGGCIKRGKESEVQKIGKLVQDILEDNGCEPEEILQVI